MNDEKLNWQGPFRFAKMMQRIPKKEGVYLWLFDLGDETRIHYIGSASNLQKRQAEHIEKILGGGYDLLKLEERNDSKWLPEYPKDMDYQDKRAWRLQQFVQIEDLRALALRTVISLQLFVAETDKSREVERVMLDIAFEKQEKKDSRFKWLANEGRHGTKKSERPFALIHKEPEGQKIIAPLFGDENE